MGHKLMRRSQVARAIARNDLDKSVWDGETNLVVVSTKITALIAMISASTSRQRFDSCLSAGNTSGEWLSHWPDVRNSPKQMRAFALLGHLQQLNKKYQTREQWTTQMWTIAPKAIHVVSDLSSIRDWTVQQKFNSKRYRDEISDRTISCLDIFFLISIRLVCKMYIRMELIQREMV